MVPGVLAEEPRRARLLAPSGAAPSARLEIPQIDQLVDQLDERDTILLDADAVGAVVLVVERVDAHSHRDRTVVPHRILDLFDRLPPEARAVLEAAAVLVVALVEVAHQEVLGDRAGVPVHVDDVEAG